MISKIYLYIFMVLFILTMATESSTLGYNIHIVWGYPYDSQQPTGYKVYIGGLSRTYDTEIDIGLVTDYILDLPNGRYFISVAAYTETNVSNYSNELIFVVSNGVVEDKTQIQRQSSGSISGGSIPAP